MKCCLKTENYCLKTQTKHALNLQTCPFGLVQILHEHDNKANRKKLELSFLPWKLVEPLARPRPSDGKSFAKPFFVGPLLIFLVSLSLSLSLSLWYIYIFLIIKLINFLFMLVSNYKLQILIFLVIIGFACRRRPIWNEHQEHFKEDHARLQLDSLSISGTKRRRCRWRNESLRLRWSP